MVDIITVTADNVDDYGFFCKMSARKSPAWQAKRDWLMARFAEGLQMRLLGDGERGFIEFMPGPKSWRAVDDVNDFVVIHCLWVVGKSRGRGFARDLVAEAEAWARDNGYYGVAALTSRGNWLIAPGIVEHLGFRRVDTCGDKFELWVKSHSAHKVPRICGGWARKAEACGPGVTVLRSAQCPYLDEAAARVRTVATELGLPYREIMLESADDVRRLSPTPYGTYALVKDGVSLACTPLTETELRKVLAA